MRSEKVLKVDGGLAAELSDMEHGEEAQEEREVS